MIANKKKSGKNLPFHSKTVFVAVAIFSGIFLFSNILFSQNIAPLYFSFCEGNKDSAVSFLKKIRYLPFFEKEITRNKTIFGREIEKEVFAEEIAIKNEVKYLERVLVKNPFARDVLNRLFVLNAKEKNLEKARSYRIRSVEVDPVFSLN